MANSNPIEARRARNDKKRERLSGILEYVQSALQRASELLSHEDPSTALRAAHAVFQGAVSYARVYEVGEIEQRLEALENEE